MNRELAKKRKKFKKSNLVPKFKISDLKIGQKQWRYYRKQKAIKTNEKHEKQRFSIQIIILETRNGTNSNKTLCKHLPHFKEYKLPYSFQKVTVPRGDPNLTNGVWTQAPAHAEAHTYTHTQAHAQPRQTRSKQATSDWQPAASTESSTLWPREAFCSCSDDFLLWRLLSHPSS